MFYHNPLSIKSYSSETVDLPVCLDHGHLPLFPFTEVPVLHSHHTAIALVIKALENILVVDLPGRWLLATRVVTDLHIGDLVPAPVDVVYQVPFVPLHVIDVKKDFARRALHCLANLVGLV